MASLKQRLEALEQAAPAAGHEPPSEIWLAGPSGSDCEPVLFWRRDGYGGVLEYESEEHRERAIAEAQAAGFRGCVIALPKQTPIGGNT